MFNYRKDEAHWGSNVLRWVGCNFRICASQVGLGLMKLLRVGAAMPKFLGSGCATGTAVLCNDLLGCMLSIHEVSYGFILTVKMGCDIRRRSVLICIDLVLFF